MNNERSVMKSIAELGISQTPWSLTDDCSTVLFPICEAEDVYGVVAEMPPSKTADADACLIKESPNLYEALRELAEACEEHKSAESDARIRDALRYANEILDKVSNQ